MSKRPKMLASTIRDLIAPILRECPKACGIVSITEIEVSTDFSYATVYVSALAEPERAREYLEAHTQALQRKMSALARKRIPLLRFRVDPRADRGDRIEKLLDGNA